MEILNTESRPRIPAEIITFLSNQGGHSLIVRGGAGSGKTTFALQTIEDLSDLERSYYLSTRVSDASLLRQFPWLKDRVNPHPDGGGRGRSETWRSGLNELMGLTVEGFAGKEEMSISLGRGMDKIEAVYDAVESNLPGRSLLVVDSIDALAERYEIPCRRLISVIQKDLVECLDANVLFILESPDPVLDYLGDGIVILSSREYLRRRLREIEIIKLRGCEITQPKYLFTLKEGRIRTFSYDLNGRPIHPESWPVVGDNGERVSTGIVDLDRMLGGGLEKGTIALIELGEGIPTSLTRSIESALVANFISQDRGALWIPSRKESPGGAKTLMAKMVDPGRFEERVRIPIAASQLGVTESGATLPVEGEDASADLNWKTVEYSFREAQRPILSLMGFDTVESIYGPAIMDQLMGHLGAIKQNRGIFVAVTSPSVRSTERLADLANVRLMVDRIGGTIVFYGKEPFTECHAVSLERRESGGGISLTPIV